MKSYRYKRVAIITLLIVVLFSGVKIWAAYLPVYIDGPEFHSIDTCAQHQKLLYQSLEYYVKEHGRLPEDTASFRIKANPAVRYWRCPETETGYELFLENYGDPNAILIADTTNKHSGKLTWWLKGLTPRVETMGDGTVYLFKDGKIMTIRASKNGR